MSQSAKSLWDKGGSIDALVHRFTVGDDPQCDRRLVHWDCVGSAAHARVLHCAGLLTAEELAALLSGLREIDARAAVDQFEISVGQEDVHTAIEAFLTSYVGEAGQKIHTGRSRNDQIAMAMRLFMRHHVFVRLKDLQAFVQSCVQRALSDGAVPMPGYTHLQPAMPSSMGMWLCAFAEAGMEQVRAGLHVLTQLDCCPLGTGAGFGVPLPLDRSYAAALTGFSRVQRNPIDVQNSRGRYEACFARHAADIGDILEKFAWDLILYSTHEFGFIALPAEMTTGSSIMPQKRNPDALELMRARAARMRSWSREIDDIRGKLPSSYHRDLQLTKAPTLRIADEVADMLRIAARVVEAFEIRHDRLRQAMLPELYATQAAYDLVRQGVPFRQAYRKVAEQIHDGSFHPDTARPSNASTDAGAAWELADNVEAIRGEADSLMRDVDARRDQIAQLETDVLTAPA
ncbi:MAG: argininosuccinate lyase [Phycisphaerales bacterium]|nr:argininosuccinate lyase [Phycisphaerales bacterium]